jgi:hypothetical protein
MHIIHILMTNLKIGCGKIHPLLQSEFKKILKKSCKIVYLIRINSQCTDRVLIPSTGLHQIIGMPGGFLKIHLYKL